MTKFQSILAAALISAMALALAGCGSGTSSGSTGKVSFFMTDAPVDEAYAVVIAMTHFEVKPAEGQPFRLDIDPDEGKDHRQINLLEYTKGKLAAIVTEELDAGEYEWLRIFFDADHSYIKIDADGGEYPFFMPSGAQTGYKVIGGFSVREDEAIDYVLDFNVRESVLEPPGLVSRFGEKRAFLLKPTVRLMEIAATGSVTGNVDFGLVAEKNRETCAGGDAVYAFEGFGVDPVGDNMLPFISDTVEMNVDGAFEYAFMFLPPGPYTLAFTCSAILDSAEGETYAETYPPKGLEFSEPINVEIVAREKKQCDIPLGESVEGPC